MLIFHVVYVGVREDGSSDIFSGIYKAANLDAMKDEANAVVRSKSDDFTAMSITIFPVNVPQLKALLDDDRLPGRTFDQWWQVKRSKMAAELEK